MEAEGYYRWALAIQEQKLAADFPTVPDYRQDLARSQHNLGVLLEGLGRGLRRRGISSARVPWRSVEERSWSPISPPCLSTAGALAVSHNNPGVSSLEGLGKGAGG